MTESQLQIQVAEYLRRQYPSVLFHSDYGSGVKLTAAQAAIQRRQNACRKGWPDMFIAQPATIYQAYKNEPGDGLPGYNKYHGLFLELKKEGTRLRKKNGEWASEHIAEQAAMLERLRKLGYAAEFAVGFDEAKAIIDNYLGGKNGK